MTDERTNIDWLAELKKSVDGFNSKRRDERFGFIDLSGANLSGANLSGANLSGADLSGADLPFFAVVKNLFTEILRIIKSGDGQLKMASWHTCETTHCMAGWAVHLAGDAGRVAESFSGSEYAGALIINASCPYLNGIVPDFHSDDETAMEFIKECAEKEVEINN